jgi:crossover junction endodeoxyribonuclease RuvC
VSLWPTNVAVTDVAATGLFTTSLSVCMIVFGIDPGSNVTGFGVVRLSRGRYSFVDAGCVRTSRRDPLARRLSVIHEGLQAALRRHEPDAVAIEAIFKHKSSESAIRLGQARGVALLAAGQLGHDPVPYNPSTIKSSVGAHGRADKDAVARMVQMLLGHDLSGLTSDATDALAIAITHCAHDRTAALRRRGGTS